MAQSAAASIVDLNEFRRRRQPPVARQPAAARAMLQAPVWIVWVPVWIVA